MNKTISPSIMCVDFFKLDETIKEFEENKELQDLARKLKNEKSKQWARKNKDKIKEINKRYWLKKAKEKLAEENKKEEE